MVMTPEQEKIINECTTVLQLDGHPAWSIIVRDAQKVVEDVGRNWVNIPHNDIAQLNQRRVEQVANQYLVDLLTHYKTRLFEVQSEIALDENQGLVQTGDVDNPPPDLEGEEDAG